MYRDQIQKTAAPARALPGYWETWKDDNTRGEGDVVMEYIYSEYPSNVERGN